MKSATLKTIDDVNKPESIVEFKPLSSFPKELIKNMELLSFWSKKSAEPMGSYMFRIQKYPADVDLIEVFYDCCSKEEVIKKFIKIVKLRMKYISSLKYHYITECKVGFDKRYDLKIGNLNHGKFTENPQFLFQITSLHNIGLLDEREYDLIRFLLSGMSGKYNIYEVQDAYDIIKNTLRDRYILRWTDEELIKGIKKKNGKIFTLKQELQEKSPFKIDMIVFLNGKFVEVTNFLMFGFSHDGLKVPINLSEYDNPSLLGLLEEIEKFFFSDLFYSPFKCVKRIFALARLNGDHETSSLFSEFISSNISLLYQLKSEIETILIILEKIGNPPKNLIDTQLDSLKVRFTYVMEIGQEDLETIIMIIDKVNSINYSNGEIHKKVKYLEELTKFIKPIINFTTINFMTSVGFNPPKQQYLPKKLKYAYKVRNPKENPDAYEILK